MNLYQIFLGVWQNTFSKIYLILCSTYGWLIILFSFVASFFGDKMILYYVIIFMASFDLFWGTKSALKLKKFILSRFLSKTAMKFGIYTTIFAMVAIPETVMAEEWCLTSKAVCVVFCMVELWSTLGHLLLLYPKVPVLRLLKKYLIGEIATKTQMTEDEVLELLNGESKNK